MNILNALAAQADLPAGTYVGANVENFNIDHRRLFKNLSGLAGSKVAGERLHTTVIYSKPAYVAPEIIEPILASYKLPVKAKIIGAAAFDALPRDDGTVSDVVSTLVLKLESPELMQLHAACKDVGCTHSYPELSPHVSLYYGVPTAECHAAADDLTRQIEALSEPLYVTLTNFFTEPLRADWEKSLKKAA